jgi:hypothetical protein
MQFIRHFAKLCFLLVPMIALAQTPPPPQSPGRAYEPRTMIDKFDEGAPKDMYNGLLLLGQDGAWGGWVYQGYHLQSAFAVGQLHRITAHFSTNPGGIPIPIKVIEADVIIDVAEPESGVGPTFKQSADAVSFCFFMVQSGGRYAVLERSGSSFGPILSGSDGALRSSGVNTIRVENKGGQTAFSINGHQLATLSSSNVTGSDAGIGAFGRGAFTFKRVLRIQE